MINTYSSMQRDSSLRNSSTIIDGIIIDKIA